MTRLQKKCLIAAAGAHLLVVVVLLCSGFITSKPKADDVQVLDMIPSTVLDNVLNSGVKGVQPPPPTPEVKPPELTPPTPEPPKPVVAPVPPVKPVEPVKPPDEVKPVENPEIKITPPKKHEIKVDLNPIVRDKNKAADDAKAAEAAAAAKAKAEAKQRDQTRKAFLSAMTNIKNKSSSATTVDMPGESSVSFANYASVVKSKYEGAWIEPDNADNDEAIVKVSVTIANDGHVTSSSIVNLSGDSKVDRSVQRTLDRVDFVAPFPEGAKEKDRTFIINFNLKAKRLNG